MVRFVFFFFNDTATTEIYTLSLHDALPILVCFAPEPVQAHSTSTSYLVADSTAFEDTNDVQVIWAASAAQIDWALGLDNEDRKSTRLNSSHANISYAVFCLKKKNKHTCRSS